ncbi:MAG: glycosyltransferase family 4 protein [Isosphaeraceae bacterium]
MRLALNYQRVDPTKGGAETYVADLCGALVHAGHQVDLYANYWREGVLPPEVRCVRVEANGWSKAQRLWDFAVRSESLLRQTTYDCSVGLINTWYHDVLIPQGGVHAASLEANARRFPPGVRRRLYLAGKAVNLPRALLYRRIEAKQYDPARRTRVVAVSEMVRGHLERFHGVPRDRIRVIPNAIDAGRLAVADPATVRAEVRFQLGLTPDDLTALFVGHNFRLKGLCPLLDALAHRKARAPQARPIHLLVCGGGKLAPFRTRVARLGLADTVHLIGFVPDIRSYFHASDFFVLPTYYDPCSLVVFEALACGLPVVTTACNGAGELITEGREGFVVESPEAMVPLADAFDRLAIDSNRRLMSEQAARLGRAQSFGQHVTRLISLFEEVAESSGQRALFAVGRKSVGSGQWAERKWAVGSGQWAVDAKRTQRPRRTNPTTPPNEPNDPAERTQRPRRTNPTAILAVAFLEEKNQWCASHALQF